MSETELVADLRRYCRGVAGVSLLVAAFALLLAWVLEGWWGSDSSYLHRFLLLAGAGYSAVVINVVVKLVSLKPEERDQVEKLFLRRLKSSADR